MSKNSSTLNQMTKELVRLKCPSCKKEHHRVYNEYKDGFGFCSNKSCSETRLLRVCQVKDKQKEERIKAELSGKIIHRNSIGNLIT